MDFFKHANIVRKEQKKLALKQIRLQEEQTALFEKFRKKYPRYWTIKKTKTCVYRQGECFVYSYSKGIFFSYEEARRFCPQNKHKDGDPNEEDDDSFNPKLIIANRDYTYTIEEFENNFDHIPTKKEMKYKTKKK